MTDEALAASLHEEFEQQFNQLQNDLVIARALVEVPQIFPHSSRSPRMPPAQVNVRIRMTLRNYYK